MNISHQLDIIKTAFEEFKVFVVEQATLNPITALAIAILFPVAICATCVWGLRKIRCLNQAQQQENILNSSVPNPAVKRVMDSITHTGSKPLETWNKKWVTLGSLAALGVGVGIYCYNQPSSIALDVAKEFSSEFSSPFQSAISNTTSSFYNLIVDNEPVTKVVNLFPNSFQTLAVNSTAISLYKNVVDAFPARPVLPKISGLLSSKVSPFNNATCALYDKSSSLMNFPSEIVQTMQKGVSVSKNISKEAVFTVADKVKGFFCGIVLSGLLLNHFKVKKNNSTHNTNQTQPNKKTSMLSSLGVVGGTALGAVANLWHNQSLFSKGSVICQPLKASAVFSTINTVQQQITKNAGGLFNLVPGTIVLGTSLAKWSFDKYIVKSDRYLKEHKTDINRSIISIAKTALMTGIVITAKQAFMSAEGEFNPSGHVMLKVAGLQGLLTAQHSSNDLITNAALGVFSLYSVVSDSAFLANTAACFHTPLDVAAGVIFAVAAGKLANVVVDSTINLANLALDSIDPKRRSRDDKSGKYKADSDFDEFLNNSSLSADEQERSSSDEQRATDKKHNASGEDKVENDSDELVNNKSLSIDKQESASSDGPTATSQMGKERDDKDFNPLSSTQAADQSLHSNALQTNKSMQTLLAEFKTRTSSQLQHSDTSSTSSEGAEDKVLAPHENAVSPNIERKDTE